MHNKISVELHHNCYFFKTPLLVYLFLLMLLIIFILFVILFYDSKKGKLFFEYVKVTELFHVIYFTLVKF